MYYKPDWPKAKQRLLQFWQGEETDRALVGVLAPRKTSKLPKFPHLTHGPWLGGWKIWTTHDLYGVPRPAVRQYL